MHRASSQSAGFALTVTGMSVIGLLSAVIDSTLGWEYLARELLIRLAQ